MKKIILNFLLVLMMSVSYQAVSATLFFTPTDLGGDDDFAIEGSGSLAGDSGQVVQGQAVGFSNWELELSEERLVTFEFSDPTGLVSFTNNIFGTSGEGRGFSAAPNSNLFTLLLKAGSYMINVNGDPEDAVYFANISIVGDIVNTPIPAAAWLFGSAIIGFIGVTRRKSGVSA